MSVGNLGDCPETDNDMQEEDERQMAASPEKLHLILNSVNISHNVLKSKIDKVSVDLGILSDDHRKLADRAKQKTQVLEGFEPTVRGLQDAMATLLHEADLLDGCADDTEECSGAIMSES
ncbi:hypothetical protein NDU88_002586 [Pleurodeles waltl]|uniref:Uncharacterized protein n=1 Tax=Pleurodeles waltl TaxID=8319 RepID=A0AAV7VD93_PLEWA|nr:hypothetical protein NDU88_002586 [Pleurodeles waltl]